MSTVKLAFIPWTAGLLPLINIHLCYLLAAQYGHVDWCLPYGANCASISASGREPPEYYVFKALMIPSAVFIAAYWPLSHAWLKSLGCQKGRLRAVIVSIGLVASVGLIMYTAVLGAIGDQYQMLRRIGVTTFFGLTFFAQLFIIHSLKFVSLSPFISRLRKIQLGLCIAVLAFGVASILLSVFVGEAYYDTLENGFEWIVTLLLCLFVLISGFMWQHTSFSAALRTGRAP